MHPGPRRLLLTLLVGLLAGCTDGDADAPNETADDDAPAAETVHYVLYQGEQAWPTTPVEPTSLGFEVPANPYLCASATCGPAQERVTTFTDGLAGTWTVEFRGAYTAPATIRAEVITPA